MTRLLLLLPSAFSEAVSELTWGDVHTDFKLPNKNFHCLHLQSALMAFLAMEIPRLSTNQFAALDN